MMKKVAILQVADTGPLESLVVMLRLAGYECLRIDRDLRNALVDLGCDTVVDVKQMVDSLGYDYPFEMGLARVEDMSRDDVIYVDVKAHRNGPKVWKRWPHLEKRTLWYRINGGKPEHVINAKGDMGDERSPPCPVITPNQWYGSKNGHTFHNVWESWGPGSVTGRCDSCGGGMSSAREIMSHRCPWEDQAYCFWPPFVRWDDYQVNRWEVSNHYQPPICLVHNVEGWGYRDLLPAMEELGVQVYGRGSPQCLLLHREVPMRLTNALAMVHVKSNDAPGYAIYEALAAGCPIICSRRLIWRSRMEELLVPGETCLAFDQATHDPLTPESVLECRREIAGHLKSLSFPQENRRVGENGRERLREIMWSQKNSADVDSLKEFLGRHFG